MLAGRWLLLIGLMLWAASPAWAGQCAITTPQTSFGQYNSFDTLSRTVVSQMVVTCSATTTAENTTGVVATVSLTPGMSGEARDRTLAMGAERLHYNIYLDPNLMTVFGDGLNGTQTLTTCQGGSQCGASGPLAANLYGAAPPGQDVAAGTYADMLTIQVVF